ncbi:MAG: sulfurtransferase TusA family protein [Rhodomicrobium sp.]
MDSITIDTCGLQCPLPVLKVRKAMRPLPAGTKAVVLATDRGAEQDLRDYCEATGGTFLSAENLEGGVLRVVIQKN